MLKNSKLFSLACIIGCCAFPYENTEAKNHEKNEEMQQLEITEQNARIPIIEERQDAQEEQINEQRFNVIMGHLQIIYRILNLPCPTPEQVNENFSAIVCTLNEIIVTNIPNFECLSSLNEINQIYMNLLDDDMIQEFGEHINRIKKNHKRFIIVRDLQIIYKNLHMLCQTPTQIFANFSEIVSALNREIISRVTNFENLSLLDKINQIFINEPGVDIPQDLCNLINLVQKKYIQVANHILSDPQVALNDYKVCLRGYLKITENIFLDYLEIPSLNKQQIPYAVDALIDFLQIDVSEKDEGKTKFFVEHLLEYTFLTKEECAYLNEFLEEKNLSKFSLEPLANAPDYYQSIRQATKGRLEIAYLQLPEEIQENVKSLFFKQLLATLQERNILDYDMLHRIAYLVNATEEVEK